MSLNLLGISRSEDVLRDAPAALGPAAVDVHWVAAGELAAATCRHEAEQDAEGKGPHDRWLAHAALVAAIHRQIDVLPARFGVTFANEEAAGELLRQRRESFLHDLDRLRGTGEIGLRIAIAQQPASMPAVRSAPIHRVWGAATRCEPNECGGGADAAAGYLAARRAHYQRLDRRNRLAQRAAEACVRAASGLYRDWRRLSPEPPDTVRLAFLVERDAWGAFTSRFRMLDAQKGGRRSTLVGPWPPYNFA